jgi:LysM repeat protein
MGIMDIITDWVWSSHLHTNPTRKDGLMKKILVYLLIMIGAFVGYTDAQEPPPPNPDDIVMIYYENENPHELDTYLLGRNICPEAILRLNPNFDINNVLYGTKLYLSTNKPCYMESSPWGRLKFYENGQWLDEPYYSNNIFYLGGWGAKKDRDYSVTIQQIANDLKTCPADLLAENYLLAYHFEAYKEYYFYSMDIFQPHYLSPCQIYNAPQRDKTKYMPYVSYPSPPPHTLTLYMNDLTAITLSRDFEVCIEEVMSQNLQRLFYDSSFRNKTFDIRIPKDAPRCYNEHGQRLTYYDENGQRLEEPVYSDLPVYVTDKDTSIIQIAERFGVCVVDLLRVNQFPDIPTDTRIHIRMELFIPPARRCPTNIQAIQVTTDNLQTASFITNICLEKLMALNPNFYERVFRDRVYDRGDKESHWVLIKTTYPPCYRQYKPQKGQSIYDIEKEINVCYEEFYFVFEENGTPIGYTLSQEVISSDNITIYMPIEVLPCYNEKGQRLVYKIEEVERQNSYEIDEIIIKLNPTYSPLEVYFPEFSESAYDISQKFNVCVKDLLEANSFLKNRIARKRHVFIPQTRPCYDEETGMPLIYEDENGNPLPEPIVGKHLIHYGTPSFGHLTYYYNVCSNRISDANADKYDEKGNARYLGYIIPTDRPPCYDENWQFAEYVCYNQPIDFDTDYSNANPPLSFDINGTYCYDIYDPNTVVWYHNKPYLVRQKREGYLTFSQTFMAWCYGISLDEISAINTDKEFLPILPYYTRAIPLPTKECYVENPEILAGKITHTVSYGDTLISISQKYGVPSVLIGRENNLDGDTIWMGQVLVIPQGAKTEDLHWLITMWAGWVLVGIPLGSYIKRK